MKLIQIHDRGSDQRCSLKKLFLEISQNPQENTCARDSFLIKLQASGLRPANLLKKRLWHCCFPVYFVKFLRTLFFKEHPWMTASNSRAIPGFFKYHSSLQNLRTKCFVGFYLCSSRY